MRPHTTMNMVKTLILSTTSKLSMVRLIFQNLLELTTNDGCSDAKGFLITMEGQKITRCLCLPFISIYIYIYILISQASLTLNP